MAGGRTMGTGADRARPARVPRAAAAHALIVGVIGAGITVLLTRRWLAGEPAVSVAELWEPGLVLFAPGDEMTSPLGGPPLVVTDRLIRVLAGGQIGLFGGFGLLGLLAGWTLLARRPVGRVAATILFAALLLLGMTNLAVLVALGLAFGGSPAALAPMAAAVGVGLVLLPGVSLCSVRRAEPHPPRPARARGRVWTAALAGHFGLLAVILGLTAGLGQDSGLLLGTWLLTGSAALAAGLALAVAHAVACFLLALGLPSARRYGAVLSGLAALALGISAILAPAGVIEQAAGLPGQHFALRVICALAAGLSAGLALRLATIPGSRVSGG